MSDCSSAALIQKTLARVQALARPRQVEGCFWIEGVRSFVQACDANLAVDTVVFSPVLLQSDQGNCAFSSAVSMSRLTQTVGSFH